VYGFEYNGLDGVTPVARTVEEIVQTNLQALKEKQATGPYHLLGHSFGGLIAFEMAQKLGDEVATLSLLDSYAPHLAQQLITIDEPTLLVEFANSILSSHGALRSIDVETLRALNKRSREKMVIGLLAESGIGIELSSLSAFFAAFEAHIHAYQTHRAERYTGPAQVILFKAEQSEQQNRDNGWSALLPETPKVMIIPGDHHSMLVEKGAHEIVHYWLNSFQH
jgi:thioesterase domain-containing protein